MIGWMDDWMDGFAGDEGFTADLLCVRRLLILRVSRLISVRLPAKGVWKDGLLLRVSRLISVRLPADV